MADSPTSRIVSALVAGLLLLQLTPAFAGVITVGPSGSIANAVAGAAAGDVIQIQPGTYTNDFPVVNVPLTIEAATPGSAVVLQAVGPISNNQGIIQNFSDLTISGLTLTGAVALDTSSSAAAVRDHGSGTLLVENSTIENSQNGIQTEDTSKPPTENVTIRNDSFIGNGGPIGPAHALYIGDAATADIINSTFCGTVVGHDIKSRALTTTVTNSLLFVGATGSGCGTAGTTSAGIDLPNGGVGMIENDTIIQGSATTNGALVIYGGESPFNAASLDVAGTTFSGDSDPLSIGVNVIGGCSTPLVSGTATAQFHNLGNDVSPSSCIVPAGPSGPSAVFEPGSLALLAVGLGFMCAAMGWQRSRSAQRWG